MVAQILSVNFQDITSTAILMDDVTRNSAKRCTREISTDSSMKVEEIVCTLKGWSLKHSHFQLSEILDGYIKEAFAESGSEFPQEAGIVVEQSAYIYSKKVDTLLQEVRAIADEFNADHENEPNETVTADQPQGKKRKKKNTNSAPVAFGDIELEEATNILRKEAPPKALPSLPKLFIHLEPRPVTDTDHQLFDYLGNRIGIVDDFRVNWSMDNNGTLCDDLDFCTVPEKPHAPVVVPPAESIIDCNILSPTDSGNNSGYCTDTSSHNLPPTPLPFPLGDEILSPTTPIPCPLDVTPIPFPLEKFPEEEALENKKRKRESESGKSGKRAKFDSPIDFSSTVDSIKEKVSCFQENMVLPASFIKKACRKRLSEFAAFKKQLNSTAEGKTDYEMGGSVSSTKKEYRALYKILSARWVSDFRGFDDKMVSPNCSTPQSPSSEEIIGFRGFPPEELTSANTVYTRKAFILKSLTSKSTPSDVCNNNDDDDDDNNNNDGGDCHSIHDDGFQEDHGYQPPIINSKEMGYLYNHDDVARRVDDWHESIREKLIKAERRQNLDMWSYCAHVLNSFEDSPKVIFTDVVKKKPPEDISRYFLATLMLANSGNVQVTKKELDNRGNFSMTLISREKRFNEDDLPF